MISIFGASVTQQKNGFAQKVKEKIKYPVEVFGYGGMHLNDAGICYIDRVIAEKPLYCFVDWFSTAYNAIDRNTEKYIDTIIFKLVSINCRPIFLFLPFEEKNEKEYFMIFAKKFLNIEK